MRPVAESLCRLVVDRSGCRLLSRGVFAVFGSHTAATINTLRSFSAAFRLPFVSTGLPMSVARVRRRRRHDKNGVLLASGEEDEENWWTVGYSG